MGLAPWGVRGIRGDAGRAWGAARSEGGCSVPARGQGDGRGVAGGQASFMPPPAFDRMKVETAMRVVVSFLSESRMKIVQYPHPALRRAGRPLTAIDKTARMQAEAMLELMYAHKGLGLAANQVALPYQIDRAELHRRPAAARQGGRLPQPRHPRTQGHHRGRRGLSELPRPVRQGAPGQERQGGGLQPQGEKLEITATDLAAAPGSTRSIICTASCSSTSSAPSASWPCATR